jgi:hypothetical protein
VTGGGTQNPVIFVPGIQGSTLRDAYAVQPETVWSVLRRDEGRVALHPENLHYELLEPARVEADGVFSRIYGGFIQELRTELSDLGSETPVFPFPYDWRLPLDVTARRLSRFIDEVIARTSLLRPYHQSGWAKAPKVDLVGHSMGGLLIAGVVAEEGSRSDGAQGSASPTGTRPAPRIGRIVTVATPFRGSAEAPIKVVTGTADLGEEDSNPRDRFAARLTPALYHLIPDYEGAVVPLTDGIPSSLWSVDGWQPSVLHSLADALERYGTGPERSRPEQLTEARTLLQSMLDEARAFRHRIESIDLAAAGLTSRSWLRIVGVDATTRVRLPISDRGDGPWFELRSADRENAWGSENPALRRLTGDGTVPWAGAQCSFLPDEEAVAIRPQDLGYWALGGQLLRRTAGFHATLPGYHIVQRLTSTFLKAQPARPGLWGWRPPGVLPEAWAPPIIALESHAMTQ